MTDPIRAWLDSYSFFDHDDLPIRKLATALRAVLDLCDDPPGGAYYEDPVRLLANAIEHTVAEHLGVHRPASI